MENIRDGESQQKEDAGARKGRKVAKHYVFPMFCGSQGSNSRLPRAAGAETSGQMRDEKVHAIVARSKLGSKMHKTQQSRTIFGKLRCRKSAPRCGVGTAFGS